MAWMDWEARFELHVKEMDDEHKHLIALMNTLHDATTRGDKRSQGAALAALGEFTVKHFRDEEAYMERIGYDGVSLHKLHHQKLLGTFQEHATRFQKEGVLDDKFFHFLRFWLASHICGIDSKYAGAH